MRAIAFLPLSIVFILYIFSPQSIPQLSPPSVEEDYRDQELFYTESIEEDNLDFEAYINLALLYKEQGHYKEAIEVLRRLCCFIDSADSKIILAELYYLEGESQKALSILKEVIHKRRNWRLFLYLGLVCEDMEEYSQAVEYYRTSLAEGQNSIALYRLGKILYKRGRFKKAKEYFARLVALDPSVRIAYFYLGDSFLKLGRYEEAYRFLSKATNFYPENRLIADRLSLAKRKLGKEFFRQRAQAQEEKRKRVALSAYRKIAQDNIPQVRVGIITNARELRFKCGGNFTITWAANSYRGEKGRFYMVSLKKQGLMVYDSQAREVLDEPVSSFVLHSQNYPFYLLNVTYGERDFWKKTVDSAFRGDLEIVMKNDSLTVVNVLSLEEYLYGVLPAEIPYSYNFEALKAQAVAARTIGLRRKGRHQKEGFDLCAQPHCQVYRGKTTEVPITNKAVDETRGEVITYRGRIIEPFYHANCGGCLRADVFGRRDYLFSNQHDSLDLHQLNFSPYFLRQWLKEDQEAFCASADPKSGFRWQRVYDEEDFKMIYDHDLREIKGIFVVKRGDCAHVEQVRIERGNASRLLEGELKIRNYFDHLRGNTFITELKYKNRDGKKVPAIVFFWGAGFGHGVGLCQEGARQMAEEEFDYKQILKHYYKGVDIKKIY